MRLCYRILFSYWCLFICLYVWVSVICEILCAKEYIISALIFTKSWKYKIFRVRDQSKPGHILGAGRDRSRDAVPERGLSAASCALVRFLTHASLFISASQPGQVGENCIFPDCTEIVFYSCWFLCVCVCVCMCMHKCMHVFSLGSEWCWKIKCLCLCTQCTHTP